MPEMPTLAHATVFQIYAFQLMKEAQVTISAEAGRPPS